MFYSTFMSIFQQMDVLLECFLNTAMRKCVADTVFSKTSSSKLVKCNRTHLLARGPIREPELLIFIDLLPTLFNRL